MAKKATIVIRLVDESEEKSNEELEREIYHQLYNYPAKIPWMKNVEKVTVTENS
jgi:hypothetical protein